jgi:phosphoribosylformylglycinamidine synthase subunit PurQ / glutaminase
MVFTIAPLRGLKFVIGQAGMGRGIAVCAGQAKRGPAMKAAVITFPGSNCDRDLAVAFEKAGFDVARVWHKDTGLPAGVDVVGVPGGFSFGDYLRCGAIAAQSPISAAVKAHAEKGGYVLGICNGFQVLTEMGLLPGALMRNAGLSFVCRMQGLRVGTADSAFTSHYAKGQAITVPVAHHDGNYTVDADGLAALRAEDRIAFTYEGNPNGAMADIAGILSANRRVLGMMPHPERVVDPVTGGNDGSPLFSSLISGMALA